MILILFFVLIPLSMWLRWRSNRVAEVPAEVRVTEDAIDVTLCGGEVRSLGIDGLGAVDLITTDQGPFVEDVFWVLTPREGEPLVVPSEAEGVSDLLSRLQELEGFDNMAVVVAMGSTDNACFPCWRASDSLE